MVEDEPFFPFGVHYMAPGTYIPWPDHSGEDFDMDEIIRDLRAIEDAGFNTLRLWISMASYNLAVADFIVQQLERMKLHAVITIGSFYVPDEYIEKHPETRFLDQQGHYNFDVYPRCCYNSPQYRYDAGVFISKIVQRYMRSPSLAAWSLHNEIMYPGSGGIYCYNPYTIEKFREWLKGSYTKIENINRRWGTAYHCFDEVSPPRELPLNGGNPIAWVDWRRFAIENLVDFLQWFAALVRSHDTKHPLTTDLTVALNYNNEQIVQEYWRFAEVLDILGFISFPDLEKICYPRMRMAIDQLHSASIRLTVPKPIWMTELEAIPHDPNALREYTWTAIAHGATGALYMRWKPISSGVEARYFGLCDIDGKPGEALVEAGKISRTLREIRKQLLQSSPHESETAIFHSVPCYITTHGDGFAGDLVRSTLGIYNSLIDEQIPVEFIRPEDIESGKLSNYKVLFMPFPYSLDEAVMRKILNFIEKGGTVYFESGLATKNDEGIKHQLLPSAGVIEIMKYRQKSPIYNRDSRTHHQIRIIEPLSKRFRKDTRLWAGGYREKIEFAPDSLNMIVIAEFLDGTPAVLESTLGNGRLYYACSLLGCGYESFRDINTRRFLSAIAENAGVNKPVEITHAGGVDHNIELRVLNGDNSSLLFVINHGDTTMRRRITIEIRTDRRQTRMILGNCEPKITRNSNGTMIDTKLKKKEVQIYTLE